MAEKTTVLCQEGERSYAKIQENDAVLLVRELGLLVNLAGIYGAAHKVIQSAAGGVYEELERTVETYGPTEIAVQDNHVLLNGSVDGLDEAVCKNLLDRMALHKIGGIEFLAPTDLSEFLTFLALFGSSPFALAEEGGFEAALRRAELRSVRVVTVAYRRVGLDTPEKPPAPEPPLEKPPESESPEVPKIPEQRRAAIGYGTAILDLSAAWDDGFGAATDDAEEPSTGASVSGSRNERAAALAALLRDTAAALESEEALSDAEQHRKVMEALSRIRAALFATSQESEHQISVLASEVDADRRTIASIECAARRRGIGLKLTRGELIERYAELNQEIIQPLTVSTGVIDLLYSGKGGPLTESQRDMLKMASDSVDRVNQLVIFMRRISGLPESYTPDLEIIEDSYR